MGLAPSKHSLSGKLQGAYAPPIVKDLTVVRPKTYVVSVPKDKKSGMVMVATIKGEPVSIKVPYGPRNADGHGSVLTAGEKFEYTHIDKTEVRKILASTLQQLPGLDIVEHKPIIWSSVSCGFCLNHFHNQTDQTTVASRVGPLLQEAQEKLLEETYKLGCNAVLGIQSNIAFDSSGAHGNCKLVVVTLMGTPCVVVPATTQKYASPVTAEAVIVEAFDAYD